MGSGEIVEVKSKIVMTVFARLMIRDFQADEKKILNHATQSLLLPLICFSIVYNELFLCIHCIIAWYSRNDDPFCTMFHFHRHHPHLCNTHLQAL